MRSGRFATGLRDLEPNPRLGPSGWSSFAEVDEVFDRRDLPAYLAIAHHHLGHPLEARRELAAARSRLAQVDGEKYHWTRALAIKLVTREAEALIERVNDDIPSNPFAN